MNAIGNATGKLQSGFTLIELSIVLVIIGLIVGGVLVGQDLIKAAAVRAQISQIEKYQAAVNAFKLKYSGYLPGDIPNPYASKYGFVPRGSCSQVGPTGMGDGNGLIEGNDFCPQHYGFVEIMGETPVFWVDLTTAGLIEGGFNTASEASGYSFQTITNLDLYFPQAKLGKGNYVVVYSGGPSTKDGNNYFSVSNVLQIGGYGDDCFACIESAANLDVMTAYNIDKKMDDGYPQTGNVKAFYLNYQIQDQVGVAWASGTWSVLGGGGTQDTSATPGSPTTCYDNNNVAGAIQQYSVEQNGGTAVNCALSFQFQ